MSASLKPCPFCGSTDIYHKYNEITGCYELGCNQCGAWPYQEGRKDDVVRKWNTRVERTCGEWRGWQNPNPSGFHDDDAELWCEHCDIELDEDWAYCPSCGAKVVEE